MFCFLMIRRPPRSTRTDTLFPTRRSSDLNARDARGPWHGAVDRRQLCCAVRSAHGRLRLSASEPQRLLQFGNATSLAVQPAWIAVSGRLADSSRPVRRQASDQARGSGARSEEHTSEHQALMRTSFAVY